ANCKLIRAPSQNINVHIGTRQPVFDKWLGTVSHRRVGARFNSRRGAPYQRGQTDRAHERAHASPLSHRGHSACRAGFAAPPPETLHLAAARMQLLVKWRSNALLMPPPRARAYTAAQYANAWRSATRRIAIIAHSTMRLSVEGGPSPLFPARSI